MKDKINERYNCGQIQRNGRRANIAMNTVIDMLCGDCVNGTCYDEESEYGPRMTSLVEEAKALRDKIWALSYDIGGVPDIKIDRDYFNYYDESDERFASFISRCTERFPQTFGDQANEYGVQDVLIARGMVIEDQMDGEHSGTYITFKSEVDVQVFMERFNEYIDFKEERRYNHETN